jgi:glutaredoxin 3
MDVKIYTTAWCGFCVRAEALLHRLGIAYERIDMSDDPAFRETLLELTGGHTVPQIVIDGAVIGGYNELAALSRSGALDASGR